MAVETSVAPSVPGPRTPYALYPELSSVPSCEHKGFLWRAGYKRDTDPMGRYTSEYQRQYQPLNTEEQKELANSRRERREKAPVADMREVLKEVQGEREEAPRVLEKPIETVGRQKRSVSKSEKRNAKRAKKERPEPFPLSEYQAQFQTWDRLLRENNSSSPVRNTKKQAPLAPHAPLPPSYSIQRSPLRWNSEYRSNFSLRASDTTEEANPWYKMVVELRERARLYRDRGRSSTLEVLQPLSGRYSQVFDSSRPVPSPPPTPTAERPPEPEPAVDTRDSITQVSFRLQRLQGQRSAVDQLGRSLTKLKVTVPPTNQLRGEPAGHALAPSPDPLTPVPQDPARARTAVPPIDIKRVQSYPSSLSASHGSPAYQPVSVPHSALSQTDPSLQKQLFRYKTAPPPDSDQLSVTSTDSLASHTLERARHRQTFWK